jgi:REP element-mobilizing transposase RayT
VKNHGQDAHAKKDHGQDGQAKKVHAQDGHATATNFRACKNTTLSSIALAEWRLELGKQKRSGTGVSPVENHGQDGHATVHGQDAHATDMNIHSQDGHAKKVRGQDAHATTTTAVKIRQGAYLPHWTRDGAFYAVTFRLADSLPSSVVKTWELEREDIIKTARKMNRLLTSSEEKRLDILFSERVEKYLDEGRGACWMRNGEVAANLKNVLQHFDGERYGLHAWCIMPNHVHAILEPRGGFELPEILHSWKSFSSKKANYVLGRTGEFWQPESYDHLIRDENDFARQVEYVLANPSRAGLKNWKWVGSGTGVSPVKNHGQGGHAKKVHGQDAHATKISPVKKHGQDAHATVKPERDRNNKRGKTEYSNRI